MNQKQIWAHFQGKEQCECNNYRNFLFIRSHSWFISRNWTEFGSFKTFCENILYDLFFKKKTLKKTPAAIMNGNSIISIWRLLSKISLLCLFLWQETTLLRKLRIFTRKCFPSRQPWNEPCCASCLQIFYTETLIYTGMESINLANTFLRSLWRGATAWISVNVVSALKALWVKHVISTEGRKLNSVPTVYIKERSEIWKSSLWTQDVMTHIGGCLLCSVVFVLSR